jgi:Bacterial SH3 domain
VKAPSLLPNRTTSHRRFVLGLIALLVFLSGCKHAQITHHEYMYVSAAETTLRDRVATLYGKRGMVHNGDRVEVLEKQRRFVHVRTDNGQEGWIEERSLVTQEIYDGFQKLAKDNANTPVEAHGTTRAELNMHIEPSRDAEHLYQLKEGDKLEILKRTITDKNAKLIAEAEARAAKAAAARANSSSNVAAPAPAKPPSSKAPSVTKKSSEANAAPSAEPEVPKPIMEDWYLARDQAGHVGWVLLRMVDLDVPLDIAQYAEGQRITGYFVLNTVEEIQDDVTKQVPQYLVLLNEPKDGIPWDYNQIRVFTRNRAKHRYETAYRERNLEGYFPVEVGHRMFDKEGELPTFTIHEKNDAGQIVAVTYKMNGPIVRRVLTPEEEAAEKAKHQADLAARQKVREQQRASRTQKTTSHKKKHH